MSTDNQGSNPAPRGLLIAAFTAVYLIWGSTYLGIHIAIETMPPFIMAGARFLIAGAFLYAVMRWRGVPNPPARHWRNATIVGGLLLAGGNGGVTWAELRVDSNVAALLVAMVPLWIALLDWARPGGSRPKTRNLVGIAVGFLGMLLMIGNPLRESAGGLDLAGTLALVFACVTWSAGSLYARYTPKPDAPLMGVALQMICGGGVLLLPALFTGEFARFDMNTWSARSLGAFLYLIIFGSLIGFTAYSWLLKASTPARVSTYAYVNPVIAVVLGWLVLDERMTPRMILAASVILLGVIIITTRLGGKSVPAVPPQAVLPPARER